MIVACCALAGRSAGTAAVGLALTVATLAACGLRGGQERDQLPVLDACAGGDRRPHRRPRRGAGPLWKGWRRGTRQGPEGLVVATRIYANELASSEVFEDQSQVEHYQPLLSALAGGDQAAVGAAVSSLVFSHTHIVRLRVSRAGVVLGDVGGPHILAPVSGTLRLDGQVVGQLRALGSGRPWLRQAREPFHRSPPGAARRIAHAAGRRRPHPRTGDDHHGPVSYRHASYQAFSFSARSFPMGPLRISLLVPVTRSLSVSTCAEITVAELGEVAQRVSRRFALSPANFSSYIKATQPLTGGLIYIRSGSRQLAGTRRS